MAAVTPRRSTRLQEKSTPSQSASSANESTPIDTPSTTSSSNSSSASATPAPPSPRRVVQASGTSVKPATSYANMAPNTAVGSPFLPTTMEAVLLVLYPLILSAGSLYAILDPTTRASPYVMDMQSHDPAFAPSYFAKKSNLFNTLFVKRGWFWITLSYFVFAFTHKSIAPNAATITKKRVQGLLRWAVATVWWIFITQWFFGPPIMDRTFTLSGGACEFAELVKNDDIEASPAERFVSSMACKAHGGKWYGGHDISGHVFLLVLGSMFLFEEVLFAVSRASRAKEERAVLTRSGQVKNADAELAVVERADLEDTAAAEDPWDMGVKLALCVGALSLWMLMMTAAYFHTWFEKLTGLIVANVGMFVIYGLPRFIPQWRAVIGMPGV